MIVVNEQHFKKLEGESVIDFVLRLADLKKDDKNITWQFIADSVYLEYGLQRSESWARRTVKDAYGLSTSDNEELLDKLTEQKQALDETYLKMKKERVKLSDERT